MLFLCFCSIIGYGCSIMRYGEQLGTLKAIGDSQADMNRYLQQQEKSFNMLLKDVKDGYLKPGASEKNIFSVYGEPVLSREVNNNSSIKKVLLYRHPTEYFSSDKIYLYFDKDSELSYWEHKLCINE